MITVCKLQNLIVVVTLALASLIPATITAQEIPGPPIVTPDGSSRTADENQTGLTQTFWIESQSSFSENFSLSCSRTGDVSSCSVQSSITIAAYQTKSVSVTFATGDPGSGTLTLTATGAGGNDQGYFNVTVTVAIESISIGMMATRKSLAFTPASGASRCAWARAHRSVLRLPVTGGPRPPSATTAIKYINRFRYGAVMW